MRANLDDAAHRVALGARLVDPLLERLGHHAAEDVDANLRQQRLRDGARGDGYGGLPGARTLEGVARVGQAELLRAGEVGVAGPRERHRLRALPGRLALGRPRAHPPLPVRVVAVADDEREGRPERPATPQAGQHLDSVLLQLLPGAAPVALLPAREVGVDRRAVEHEPRGEAGHDGHQRGTVRLACGCQPQAHVSKPTAACIAATGASIPVQSSNDFVPWRTSASSPSTTSQPAARAAAARAVGRPSG